ncbi:glycoside hydrolase family 3 C-terminal domain-containing protein [Micromonospora rubida]
MAPGAARSPGAARTATDPHATQRRLVAALLGTGKPVVVVAVRDRYDIAYLPGVTTCPATHSYTRAAMDALVRALHGELSPSGRPPVTIPTAEGWTPCSTPTATA